MFLFRRSEIRNEIYCVVEDGSSSLEQRYFNLFLFEGLYSHVQSQTKLLTPLNGKTVISSGRDTSLSNPEDPESMAGQP